MNKSDPNIKLGGSVYCEKCKSYHPVLPFCPILRVREELERRTNMSHHGEHVFSIPKGMNREIESENKWFLEQLEKNHSDATKRMFTEFTRMYNEIKSMGIDPEQLWKSWRMK